MTPLSHVVYLAVLFIFNTIFLPALLKDVPLPNKTNYVELEAPRVSTQGPSENCHFGLENKAGGPSSSRDQGTKKGLLCPFVMGSPKLPRILTFCVAKFHLLPPFSNRKSKEACFWDLGIRVNEGDF